jgi:hypothetical protein
MAVRRLCPRQPSSRPGILLRSGQAVEPGYGPNEPEEPDHPISLRDSLSLSTG